MKRALAVLAFAVATTSSAVAADATKAVDARKAVKGLYSHYLGQLGAMAKGEAPYDAAVAGSAAASLAALTSLDQSRMWPQGSDNGALGDKTRALPAIWSTYPAVMDKSNALAAAVGALNEKAGTDLDGLRGAMGPVGKACGACHEDFRQPRE